MKSFRSKVAALALTLSLGMNLVVPQNSHAIVGVIAKTQAIKVTGGIVVAGGGLVGLVGLGYVLSANAVGGWEGLGAAIGGAALLGYGLIIVGIGLVVLDAEQGLVDFEYREIDREIDGAQTYPELTSQEIETYNEEISELNLVRQEILSQTSDDASEGFEATAQLWREYGEFLSPETLKVAAHITGLAFANVDAH